MKKILITAILTFGFTALAIQAIESSIFSAEGIIESTSGGFMFPDGSVQVTAVPTGCVPITYVPIEILEEGVYCLTGNLETDTLGPAIWVKADNVVIDLNGWTLDGLVSGAGTLAAGVYANNPKNLTIRNGTIRGFLFGIAVVDPPPYTTSQGHLIEDIRAVRNTHRGIDIMGTGSIIRRNQVVNTGGTSETNTAYGISLTGPGNRILNNDVINTAGKLDGRVYGIAIASADGTTLEGNRIDDVNSGTGDTFGIIINTSPLAVLARDNSITSTEYGIFMDKGSQGKYKDNLTGNVSVPFSGGTDAGGNN